MTQTRSTGFLGILVACLLLSPLRAEEPPQPSVPRAVLIGISDYADKQIKPRAHAEDDVKSIYDLLTDKQYLGIDKKNVRLLLGKDDKKRDSQPATRANVLKAVEWLAAESKRDDLTLFVFVGEGGPLGDKSERRCYFASDSTFKDRGKTAVAASEIEERLQKLKSQRFAAFVDIDFKGFTVDKGVPDATLGTSPYREFLGDDGTEEHGFQPGRVVYLATNGLSVSLDLKDHGLFSHVVLAGLKGAADKEGYEPDGVITVNELATYINKEMPKLAREHGKTDDEKDQVHFILRERGANQVGLTSNPAESPRVRKRLEKLKKLIGDRKLPPELADEGHKMLSQMPTLESQQVLRKEYQRLTDGNITAEKFKDARDKLLASLKLERDDAVKFANKVLEASEVLIEEYVKKLEKGELVGWAVRGLYRRANEKVPDAITERLAKAKKLKGDELKELLVDARIHLGKREDLAGGKDVDIALSRMFSNLDPYSTYIDPQSLLDAKKHTEGTYTGIGVKIGKDRETDMLVVTTPMKGSPAFKAGMRTGDIITTITCEVDREGKPLPKPDVFSTKGLAIGEAVKRIQGQPGTKVKIRVQRPGVEKPLDFELSREKIEMETVMGARRKNNSDAWDFMIDPATKIGYIRLSQFNRRSGREMARAAAELKKAEVRGLVLDLRFNPGGLLTVAREITDLFIDDGLIVTIRPREGTEDQLRGFSGEDHLNFPMVCLVNGGSASGSEIVAAALQDHKRAVIMGERSYGKGSVQNVLPFGGGEIKMTTASFWRPSGKNLNKSSTKGRDEDEWGVVPDKGYDLPLSRKESDELEEHMEEQEVILAGGKPVKKTNPDFKDRQLDLALTYLRDQVKLGEKYTSRKLPE